MVVSPDGELVFTASSDRTVKLWRPHSDARGEQVTLMGYHSDFVKCLAYAPTSSWLCSGGLDGKIHLWDVNAEGASPTQRLVSTLTDTSAPHASYYAVAVGPAGRLVAGGSPDGLIRLWDPRADPACGTFSHFTGHTDSVRSLLLSHDNRWMISASSDSTVKLWSLGSQRCVKTYTMHSDPVWCLFSSDPDLRHFYAGGRGGVVTKTVVSNTGHHRSLAYEENESEDRWLDEYDDDNNSVVVCREQAGITSIVATADHLHLWTATSRAQIHRWEDVPPAQLNPAQVADDDESSQPMRSAPVEVLAGTAGLIRCQMLADRRHVLSLDSEGQVALWDIVRARLVERLGKVSLDAAFQARNPAVAVPSWCAVDTKIGAICVRLDQSRCFDAEVYQDELDLPDAAPDELANLGRWVLRSLFATVVRMHVKSPRISEPAIDLPKPLSLSQLAPPQPAATLPPPAIPFLSHVASPSPRQAPPDPPEESIPPPPPALSSASSGFMGRLRQFSVKKLSRSPDQVKPPPLRTSTPVPPLAVHLPSTPESASSTSSGEQDELPSPTPQSDVPFVSSNNGRPASSPTTPTSIVRELDLPPHLVLQLSEESGDVATCIEIYSGTLAAQAAESAQIISMLPLWISDCIFKNVIPYKEPVKIGFLLKPHEASGLVPLPSNARLLASRVLRCKKVGNFVWEKLSFTPDKLLALLTKRQAMAAAASPLSGPKPGVEASPEGVHSATLPPFTPENWIILRCNDQVLEFNMTLATVRQFMWRAGGDMVITYDLQPHPIRYSSPLSHEP
ncbi:hypothetical protein L0F63_003939 [Massospora cicadina]|nr:hypothetical protein L0F63_003939 [Massospora cicadina]